MRKSLLFFIFIISTFYSFAGHRAGGEYSWECINDSTYVITYVARVDCAHNYDPITKYCLVGSLAGDPNNGTYQVDSAFNVDFPIPFCASLATCQNGGFYNWQSVNVYSDTIVLQQPISPWYTIQHCDGGNRPTADNTSGGWYVEANFNIVVPCNSSPVATSYHDVIFCIGDSAVIQNDFVDADGDSMVFYLTNCLDAPGASLTYNAPYTPTNPLTSATGWTIDSVGNISFLPSLQEHGTVCLMIEEWRNGVLISNNIQDMYINFIDCNTSLPADTPQINDVVIVDEGCSGTIFTTGYKESSITYNSINPLPLGAYNSYLSCTSGCDTTFVTAQLGYPPFIDYQVCGVPSSGCDTVSLVCDTVRVFFYSTLGVQINPVNPAICFGTGSTVLTATGSGGVGPYSYLWNTGAATANLTVTAGGWYYVTVTDQSDAPCNTSVDSVFVEVFTLPIIANAGPDNFICAGDTIALTGSVQVALGGIWSGGSGTFIPSDTSLITSYIPSPLEIANGNVELYLTTTGNRSCPPDIDTVSISILKFSAAISTTINNVSCLSGNDGSAAINLTGGTGPFTITWNTSPIQTGNLASGLIAGTYVASLSDGNGCDTVISVIITEPTSVISLTIDTSDVSCFGGNDGTGTVTPSGGTAPYTYLWDVSAGSQTDSTAIGLIAGTYGVTVFDQNGCIYEPSIIVTQPPLLSVSTSFSDVNCFGGNDGVATVSISGGTGPYTVLWDAAAGNQIDSSAINLVQGTYLVDITDANGCLLDTNVTVSQPTAGLSLSTSVISLNCFGDTDGSATVSISGGTSPYTVLWDPTTGGQTDTTAIALIGGNYGVLVTDTNGCFDSVGVTIIEPQVLSVSISDTINVSCNNGNDGGATALALGGTTPYSYLWSANAGSQTDSAATGLVAGNFGVLVTDVNGCSDSATVLIIEPNPLILTISPNDTICLGDLTAIWATVIGGNGGNDFAWTQGLPTDSNHNVSPIVSTTYTALVTDALGCTGNVDSVTVYIYSFDLSGLVTSSGGDVCVGNPTTITGNYTGGIGSFTFSWNQGLGNNLGTFPVTPLNTTDYILTITDQCSDSIADTITVNVFPYPIISLPSIYDEGCAPYTVNFVDSLNNNNNMTYLWSFGDGATSTLPDPSYTYINDGTYNISLSVRSSEGCTSSSISNSIVNIFPSPTALFIATPAITDIQNPTIAFTNQSTGAVNNLWDYGNGDTSSVISPVYTYSDTGTYIVNLWVINQFGCINEFELPIIVDPFYSLIVPNAFTPNSNGGNGGTYDITSLSNDVFYPFTEYVEEFEFFIFNRWGELIFVSDDLSIGWDGYYRGNICQQDTYVWKINITYVDGQKISKVGDITLIR